ncbi:MAG: glycosyl transferase family protein [Alphaproteobacteria bacterium]|nr:MAG: glycosyl transferase family protein [Alphaproteobacteria bacterium]
MEFADFSIWQWLAMVQHELLLFAGFFFLIGAIDDFAVDLYWLWLRVTGQARTPLIDTDQMALQPLAGRVAIFIPAWHEEQVIGDTIAHALKVWPQADLRLYVGCYRNDWGTIRAAMAGAPTDARLRLVFHDRSGPTTKADCLNRLYRALCEDEGRSGNRTRMVVFHDAEDMVDPAALAILDWAIGSADFVQMPVLPLPQQESRWLGSHYCEEFAEAHGKTLVVRQALGAAIPAAGVGCAIARDALDRLAQQGEAGAPFAADSLTEDYEMGLAVAANGGRCSFVRARHRDGSLVATRAYFPSKLDHVVRQKTRWVHGIALQGWDRTGWTSKPSEIWMRLRDRRGPMSALVLLTAYLLLAISALGWGAHLLGHGLEMKTSPELRMLLAVNVFAFTWRAVWRFGFTAREFGIAEGVRAVLRIPVANIIAIMAGRRALYAYVRSLAGRELSWDKTPHFTHPARQPSEAVAI